MNWFYLIEAGLIHLLLYLGYHVFLRKQTDYQYLRLYLLGAMILALVTPLIDLPILPQSGTIARAQEILLQPVIISSDANAAAAHADLSWQLDLRWIPMIISGLLGLSMLLALGQILWAFLRSHKTVAYGIAVRKLSNENTSFTFLRSIFIPEEPDESVIRHEKGHADLLHSIDVLLAHTFRILFWWTPSCWWTIRELRLIHEYQADERALQNTSVEDYKKILISRTLSSMNLNLASSFHHGALLKRLEAMQAKRESIHKWRTGILGILVATTVIVFSCTDGDIREIAQEANMSVAYPDAVKVKLHEIEAANPGQEFTVLEIKAKPEAKDLGDGNGHYWEFKPEIQHKIDAMTKSDMILHMDVESSEEVSYVIIAQQPETFQRLSDASHTEDGIYTIVEEKPQFDGGIEAFYAYIAGNLKYPEQARKRGVEGKVFIEFVIEKDGSVSNVAVAKGIGAGCDAEALRVMESSPQWAPGKVDGKTVRTKIIVPIMYKLNNTPDVVEVPPPPPGN